MTADFRPLVKALSGAAITHAERHGHELVAAVESSTKSVRAWIAVLRPPKGEGVASELLDAAHAAVVETSGALSLGLVRPAVFSIRSQIDLLLAWVYFKDHAVEWSNLIATGEGYLLREGVLSYLRKNHARFERRFKLLLDCKSRPHDDPYHVLSAHVHSQSPFTFPRLAPLAMLVQSRDLCNETVLLQSHVDEYLSDVLVAVYADSWQIIPAHTQAVTSARLGPAKLKDLVS